MIINKVTLAPFGGVHGREVSFAPGLNVVLGANEAGKSTMVNALYAALFIPTDIRRNSQLWKDYLVRFLPYDGGDTMQVTVDFQSEAREKYSLTRSWGATRVCRLDVGSGAVITNEATVQAKLDEILGHGRGTYEGVLFARQEEMIQTVEMLRHNTEAAATLGDVLRAALMQAGGVSIDELALELASTKKAILDNWDSERAAPKNNRGVDRPYVNKVGRLLAAFYAKERLKRELRTTQEAEARVDAALATLESVVAEKAIMQPQKIALEALESDIYKRAQLEPFVEKLRLQQEQLKIVNRDWPKEAERNQNLEKRILTEQTRQKNLTAELELARAAVANKKLRECYLVANPLMEELEEIQRRLAELPVVSATDVEWLEQQFALISSKETELKAMKLEAIMTVQQAQTITVSAALNDPQTATVEEEASFTGAGRLLFTTAAWTLQVQAGQIDVEALLTDIATARTALQERLASLALEDLPAVRAVAALRQQLKNQSERLQAKMEGALQGHSYAELAVTVEALTETMTRDPDTVLAEQMQVITEIKFAAEQAQEIKERLLAWERKYGHFDAVMDALADLRSETRAVEQELQQLAPLPAEFANTDAFLLALRKLRETSLNLEGTLTTVQQKLMAAQRELGEETAEDVATRLLASQQHFSRVEKEAQALYKVEERFTQMMARLDQETFTPFVAAFCRYLAPATGYRYQAAVLEGVLPSKIETTDGKSLPMELLSTGTTRGIALALRLAMAEFLLQESMGFLVMDDPLVDLDPQRKGYAATMVHDYAQNRQVIITTCDPDTATRLGGQAIML